jgi:hypothetical protein
VEKSNGKASCQIRRKDKSNIKEALKNKKRPAQTQRNIAFELALFC